MTLQTLIDCLAYGRNIHICVHDVSGILTQQNFSLNIKNIEHSTAFCSYAKNTEKGYKLCVSCKRRAIKKAVEEKSAITGRCLYGVHEIVQAVEINGTVMAIIFISNLMPDPAGRLNERIAEMSRILGVSSDGFRENIDNFCKDDDFAPYVNMANLIHDFMIELYDKNLAPPQKNNHWVVSTLINHIRTYYNKDTELSLRRLSQLYYFNENYIGRLFKKQTGKTFSQYLNGIRLKKSVDLLINTDRSVIYIALSTGFNSVTYFNRLFKKRYGVSPSEYRTANRNFI